MRAADCSRYRDRLVSPLLLNHVADPRCGVPLRVARAGCGRHERCVETARGLPLHKKRRCNMAHCRGLLARNNSGGRFPLLQFHRVRDGWSRGRDPLFHWYVATYELSFAKNGVMGEARGGDLTVRGVARVATGRLTVAGEWKGL